MATMNMGFLPQIKCSNCGNNVEISSMGDHVCAPVVHGTKNIYPESVWFASTKKAKTLRKSQPWNLGTSKTSSKRQYIQTTNTPLAPVTPPSPPPSAGLDSSDRLTAAMATKPGRSGVPPRIDPSIASMCLVWIVLLY